MNVIEAAMYLRASVGDTDENIKKRWREAASRWHPDRGGDDEAMQTINAAKDYLLSMSRAARMQQKKWLVRQVGEIFTKVCDAMDMWEARVAARASVTNNATQSQPSVTNKRRAAAWEARNRDKVREQTKARVKAHRDRDPDAYRAYMREYMRKRRERATP
jgi:curved DNA-binding protein CbpA